jgi:hypothetical protein
LIVAVVAPFDTTTKTTTERKVRSEPSAGCARNPRAFITADYADERGWEKRIEAVLQLLVFSANFHSVEPAKRLNMAQDAQDKFISASHPVHPVHPC